MCSTFLVTCKLLRKTDPEHSYKFFPQPGCLDLGAEANHKDSGHELGGPPQPTLNRKDTWAKKHRTHSSQEFDNPETMVGLAEFMW